MLMLTTMVAAGVGVLMAKLFGLTAVGLTASAAEAAQGVVLQSSQAAANAVTLPAVLLRFIPATPFLDMTSPRKTSTIAVAIFAIFVGLAATGVALKELLLFASCEHFINVAQAIIMHQTQTQALGTPAGIANFSALFGATMGQNRCLNTVSMP